MKILQKNTPRIIALALLIALGSLGLGIRSASHYYSTRILSNVFIQDIPVGDLTREEAMAQLEQKLGHPLSNDTLLEFSLEDITIATASSQVGLEFDTQSGIDRAFTIGKDSSLLNTFLNAQKIKKDPVNVSLDLKIRPLSWQNFIESIRPQIETPGERPQAVLTQSGNLNSLEIIPGEARRVLDQEKTQLNLLQALSELNTTAQIAVASEGAALTDLQTEVALDRASLLVGDSLSLTYETRTLATLDDTQLVNSLALPEGYHRSTLEALVATISAQVDRPAREAVLNYDPETLVVSEFVPPSDGLKLDSATLVDTLVIKLAELESILAQEPKSEEKPDTSVPLPVAITKPTTELGSTNSLVITEKIGFGESQYHHSIATRVNNVSITAKYINNTLVPPGAEYSFNETLGDISRERGYQPAYVIQGGRTVLGDGGGVCQVSSTLFRAVLDSGLEITRRLPHSYRVSYYELNSDPGFDATVYSGNIDFRFRNDTDHHILVHTDNDADNRYLAITLYGTSDGRRAEISEYKTWGWQSQLAAQYFPDPTLPRGVTKQIDWGVSGINASFKHTVWDKNGEILYENTYTSKYRPWSSKFLVGEG